MTRERSVGGVAGAVDRARKQYGRLRRSIPARWPNFTQLGRKSPREEGRKITSRVRGPGNTGQALAWVHGAIAGIVGEFLAQRTELAADGVECRVQPQRRRWTGR